jgi:hypothetical protein
MGQQGKYICSLQKPVKDFTAVMASAPSGGPLARSVNFPELQRSGGIIWPALDPGQTGMFLKLELKKAYIL